MNVLLEPDVQVDRKSRDVLGECIRQYFEGQLKPEEVWEVVSDLPTEDALVKTVMNAIVLDALDEDLVPAEELPKASWDLLQRYLLLLDSNRSVHHTYFRIWTYWQVVAAAGIVVFVTAVFQWGWLNAFTWLSLPSGLGSWYIARKKSVLVPCHPFERALYPFHSFESMRQTLDEVRREFGFEKLRHPAPPKEHEAPRWSGVMGFLFVVCLLPTIFILPFQMLPVFASETRVTDPQPLTASAR